MIGKLRIAILGMALVGLLVPTAALAQEERPASRQRAIGEITAVDLGSGSFSLQPRDGEAHRYLTGERTRFRGNDVDALEDLEPGMKALVVSVETDDGSLALLIAARKPKPRPRIDLRAVGEVITVGDRSFTLQRRNGEQLTMAVNAETKFKGISSFDQLQVGMVAAVAAVETDDGWLAVLVGARERRSRPEADRQQRPERQPQRTPEAPVEQGVSA